MSDLRAEQAVASRNLLAADWPAGLRVAVLGPHPDDFDVDAVTLKLLQDRSAEISVAVLSQGISGVEPAYCPRDRMAESRRAEQIKSCRMFGLPDAALRFLPLEEDADTEPMDCPINRRIVADWLLPLRPDLIFLPHGHDQKGGHRNVYALLRAILADHKRPAIVLLHRDPKTVAMQTHAFTPYDQSCALWKAALLRCHDTQHQRNLNTRGIGLDERILAVDRAAAAELNLPDPYAETFEVELHR